MVQKTKEAMKNILLRLKKAIEDNHAKSNWINIGVMITNIMGLVVNHSISSEYAEAQDMPVIYLSRIAAIIMCGILCWEFICLVGYQNWEKVGKFIQTIAERFVKYFQNHSRKYRIALFMIIILALVLAAGIRKNVRRNYHTTEYYTSVTEVYGLPTGVGDPLDQEELDHRSGYWRIDDYPYRQHTVLTYVDPYQQMELMRKYSRLYSMELFQTPARIEYEYTSNTVSGRYLNKISYYSSSGKLLLELDGNGSDQYELSVYSPEERPQLFQSTLLRIPDDQTDETDLESQQIEVRYDPDGLPSVRRLCFGLYNQYGVNGERYVYDENRQLSKLYYLDHNGNTVCNKLGIMMISFEYETPGKLRSIRYYSDENGKEQTEGFYGVFCENFTYDKETGNLTERKQLNRSESSWVNDTNGVYRYEYDYQDGALT